VESIWDSGVALSSDHRGVTHGVSIPHDELGLLSLPVIDKRHKISIILLHTWYSTVPLVIKDLSSRFCFAEINSAGNFFFLEIVFENSFEENIILSCFVFWESFSEFSNVGELVFVADERLFDNWELH
jgi:hypothetical protein